MKRASNGLKTAMAIATIASAAVCQAQTAWIEDFEHNDPGLYTNPNGGPDNFDVVVVGLDSLVMRRRSRT